MASSSVELGASSPPSLGGPTAAISIPPHPKIGIGGACSSSLGAGRRSRTPLADLDSRFITKSGLCGSLEGECQTVARFGPGSNSGGVKISHVTSSAINRDDTVPRFPRLDQCAHFHYEYVELPPIQLSLVSEELKPLSQSQISSEDSENKSLLVQVTSLGRSWVVRRTYENFRFLDKQLHRCCYDRKISVLSELPSEENVRGDDREAAIEDLLRNYLARLSDVAGSLITCGPVLSWMELDNRGHRLIVTDDSDINTPAVAAAYVVKRYTAQASDEISFEVGDMISVIDMPPPEESIWWRGKRGFQVGFFPCECVQVIGDKVPSSIHSHAFTLPPRGSALTTSTTTTVTTTVTGVTTTTTSALSGHHTLLPQNGAQEPLKPVLRKHGKLIAFFRSFILSRPSRRKLKQSGILRERVFGCDLGENLMNSGHDIPMVLKCCSEFIETHGTVDGIYRLSGITSNIQKLRNAFDEERVPDLYGDEQILQDIHCVSSVLKMYFRELPNPLLTYQLYDKFASAVMQEEDMRLLHVRDVVQQLPPPHYRTLEYLIKHLARIAAHSSKTGMTPKNIAIVWAPNLLRSKDLEKGGVAALQDVGTQAVVTEYLVRYVELIFNDKIPNFSPAITGSEILQKNIRPKSLAISTPTKLISIDEARKRALAALKTDQNYIEVGGGPQSLPKTYHTVIDLPSRKGGSLKHKKSPSGWKTLFSKNKHQRKSSTPSEAPLNISDSAVVSTDNPPPPSKTLRPVKSVESLVSTPMSVHSNSQVISQLEKGKKMDMKPLDNTENDGSLSNSLSPIPSPRTHNRSISHDSYFNLLDNSSTNLSRSGTVKEERESDVEFSPDIPNVSLELGLSELHMDFNTSEPEMRVFSEDETLQSTSLDDTLSRSTIDMENISMGSDSIRSRENVSTREKRTFKDKLKHTFSSASQKKATFDTSLSEDSRSNSLKRASTVIKDKIVHALSPETARKKDAQRNTSRSPSYSPKTKHIKVFESKEDTLSVGSDTKSEREIKQHCSSGDTLIEPDLLEKITRMRISPVGSSSDLSTHSMPDSDFCHSTSNDIAVIRIPVESAPVAELSQSKSSVASVTIIADVHSEGEKSMPKEMIKSCEDNYLRKNNDSLKPTPQRDRPSSLLGIPTSELLSLGSSLMSPETPQGDSTFLEIQYDPLSDTTEPSTPSETHFGIKCESTDDVNSNEAPPNKHSSPYSPDISSSSADDPIDNAPMYENIEIGVALPLTRRLLDGDEVANVDSFNGSPKLSPEVETPTAPDLEYENIKYHKLEVSSQYDSDSRIAESEGVTPCYENVELDFSLQHYEDVNKGSCQKDDKDEEELSVYENLQEMACMSDNNHSGSAYEECSFNESNEYENVDFSKEDLSKTDAEIEGEVVYQQVRYLRKAINEVNGILCEHSGRTETNSFNGGDPHSLLVDDKMVPSVDILPEKQPNDGNECLESPVSPSSSSVITEMLVLPSFSSPTESTTEDTTSPDASESQIVSPSPTPLSTDKTKSPSLTPLTSPISVPLLSPPSPDQCPPSVPPPVFPAKKFPFRPPIPKPRSLPSVISGPSVITSTGEALSSSGTPNGTVAIESVSSVACISSQVNLNCSNDANGNNDSEAVSLHCVVTHEVPESPTERDSVAVTESGDSSDPEKRERINKIKEERRSFLRKKFPSDSFKGEKDEMILRLKQKATSPSRHLEEDSDSLSPEVFPKEILLTKALSTSPGNNYDEQCAEEFDVDKPSTPIHLKSSEPITFKQKDSLSSSSDINKRFHASDQANYNRNIFDKKIDVFSSNSQNEKLTLGRSLSEEPKEKICKESQTKLSSTSDKVKPFESRKIFIPGTEPIRSSPKDSSSLLRQSKELQEQDINVKERVAIWSRHEEASVSLRAKPSIKKDESKENSIDRKSLSPTKTTYATPLASKFEKPVLNSQRRNTVSSTTSESIVGKPSPPIMRLHSTPSSSYERNIKTPLKSNKITPKPTEEPNTSAIASSTKFSSPLSPKQEPILMTQKSEGDIRNPIISTAATPMRTSRSYSVTSTFIPNNKPVLQQKKIKDIAARFEKDSLSSSVRPTMLRQVSKE